MFTKLETKDMEEICNGIYKKLNKMSKELKVRINENVHNTDIEIRYFNLNCSTPTFPATSIYS